jgi:hypothetical protein
MKSDKRISKYLSKIEPAYSGRGGHNQTFYVAQVLIHGFRLSITDAMPFMREYSSRCSPPWKERELKHKLESAKATGPGKIKKL